MPCGGPGTFTTVPTDRGLYCGGHVEVPAHCNPTQGLGSCGNDECCSGGCGGNGGCSNCQSGGAVDGGSHMIMREPVILPGGSGYDDSSGGPTLESTSITDQPDHSTLPPPSRQTIEAAEDPHHAAPPVLPPQESSQDGLEEITLPVHIDEPGAARPLRRRRHHRPLPIVHRSTNWHYPVARSGHRSGRAAGRSTRLHGHTALCAELVFLCNATRPYNPQPAKPQTTTRQVRMASSGRSATTRNSRFPPLRKLFFQERGQRPEVRGQVRQPKGVYCDRSRGTRSPTSDH